MLNKGKIFLIPAPIAAGALEKSVSSGVLRELSNIRHFLAEDIRSARRYLASLKVYSRIEDLSFSVLDKDTKEAELPLLLAPALEGHNVGVLSESGSPGIADPGALAVRFGHQHHIRVIPLVGPSSIFLALAASGLNGQQFAFHGYLPIQQGEAVKAIRGFEKESRLKNQTQIFIETPFRNNRLFTNLVKTLQPHTELCLAVDITGEHEFIVTRRVQAWRLEPIEIPKIPSVFLFLG